MKSIAPHDTFAWRRHVKKSNLPWIREEGEIPSQIRVNLLIRDTAVVAHLVRAEYGQITAEANRLLRAGLIVLNLSDRLADAAQELQVLMQRLGECDHRSKGKRR